MNGKKRWYELAKLKHVTGFLTPMEKAVLKKLAEREERSLTRYVSRILREHIKAAGAVAVEIEPANRKIPG